MIQVSNSIIRIGSESYPTKNIASFGDFFKDERRRVSSDEQRRKIRSRLGWAFFIGVAVPLIYDKVWLPLGPYYIIDPELLRWLCGILGVIIAGYALLARDTETVRRYAVRLIQNSGHPVLIWTESREFRDEISKVIEKSISSSADASYSINIEKQEITNNTSTFVQSSVTNNYDYSISYNNYDGLTQGQVQFLAQRLQ